LSDGAAETLAVVAAGTGNRLRISVEPDQDGAAAFRIAAATDWRGQQPVALSSNINATAIAAGDWHYIEVSLRTETAQLRRTTATDGAISSCTAAASRNS